MCWSACATLMPSKKKMCAAPDIGVFTMRDIDERGMRTVMEEALRMAGTRHRRLSHLARHGLGRS